MRYNSICVAGVDGTGKSSTIDMLKEQLGEDCVCVQYMGARLWETSVAQKYIGASVLPKCNKIKMEVMRIYALIYEMYYRVYKHRKTDKIVVFDRYASEQSIFREANSKGIFGKTASFFYTFFLLWLFPKPDLTFYLECPIEVSISRKTDINSKEEIEGLKRNKKLLDDFYENRHKVIVFDTSKDGQQLITQKIIGIIRDKFRLDEKNFVTFR